MFRMYDEYLSLRMSIANVSDCKSSVYFKTATKKHIFFCMDGRFFKKAVFSWNEKQRQTAHNKLKDTDLAGRFQEFRLHLHNPHQSGI